MRRAHSALLVLLLGAAAAVAACSRDDGLRCMDEGDYAASRTAPPVRVPEGLTVPNDTDALTIPPAGRAGEGESAPAEGCLERPPDYFEGGEPGA